MQELIRLPLNVYTDTEKREAWDKASKTVEDFSNELIDQWNKEIDGLLTFVRISGFDTVPYVQLSGQIGWSILRDPHSL